ncbi:hypothetical protein [Actinocrispum sp. NPDC049592]|uniref:hypothetical protein n=1 Tax=Actinocrispum sp. NPDC049592 TaxID=3154835 RepID=UPI00343A90B5
MKLAAVRGVTTVSLRSVQDTTTELLAVLTRVVGNDPTLEVTASQAAEVAHRQDAALVAVVEHPDADPGILVGAVIAAGTRMDAETVEEMRYHLADTNETSLREVTQAQTPKGHPVVIIERILLTGAQLQAIVTDPASSRAAVFTLHSPTGRGWLELAAVAGHVVSGVEFTAPARVL